jgi:hypothetical protein
MVGMVTYWLVEVNAANRMPKFRLIQRVKLPSCPSHAGAFA